MKPNHYKILSDCVYDGAIYGVMRAFKYNEMPTEEQIADRVRDAVMNEICEHYDFEPHSSDEDY
jgi:hypothetical protein